MRTSIVVALAGALSACAVKPVLYPNPHYTEVGKDQARQDVRACDQKADEYAKSEAAKRTAEKAGEGAAVGAAAGAVTGAIFGDLARGAVSGAAAGAAVGLVHGVIHWRDPSPAHRAFVDRCLHDQGYDVIGWQ